MKTPRVSQLIKRSLMAMIMLFIVQNLTNDLRAQPTGPCTGTCWRCRLDAVSSNTHNVRGTQSVYDDPLDTYWGGETGWTCYRKFLIAEYTDTNIDLTFSYGN